MPDGLRPLGGRVLLRRPPIPERIGLIHIPEKARMIPQEGTVVAVTRGVPCPACGHHQEPSVKVGEQVLHGRYSRMSLPEQGPDLYLVYESDLMAVLEDAGPAVTEEQAWAAYSDIDPMLKGPQPT